MWWCGQGQELCRSPTPRSQYFRIQIVLIVKVMRETAVQIQKKKKKKKKIKSHQLI